ncbi:MAG: 50S ribosomal protein L22 [Deltaproteobacteria bacterium]|jgi:large subunit ribosomal protein L22|nr:50S ribosomal protein L22 [Deltaproteobacteria bacterium]MBW1853776.1 50S ribosomal protein L22 [Deltaproteobacteria bacterium]MBW2183744.1 50S ribosomal protein L22 [Deltaproteobacteria bacterium]
METVAVAKYIRMSPQKIRLVADLIRGKKVEDALNLLSFTPKASAPLISKVLKSAVANAGQKKGVDVDTLIVKSILVDEGPTMKRFRARAMGRGTSILKRSSHIKIIVEES